MSGTLREWVRQAERGQGLRSGLTIDQVEDLKKLRCENRELRWVNEILWKASVYFAQADASTVDRGDDRVLWMSTAMFVGLSRSVLGCPIALLSIFEHKRRERQPERVFGSFPAGC